MEIWRDAPGFEGLYQVSNEGNAKSLARVIVCKDGRIKHYKEKLLKPADNGIGYLFVNLCKDGKKEDKYIHKLIAEVFIPNPHGYTEVNHKDEDKTNNTVWINEDGSVDLEKSNLEWCDRLYNMNYGTRNQRIAEALSKPVYQRTLNRRLVKIWSSSAECGRNGFSSSAVADCCNNKYMREGNNVYKEYIWEYGD